MSCIPTGRREIKVRGDENGFYRAIWFSLLMVIQMKLTWCWEMCNYMIAEYTQVFIAYFFRTKNKFKPRVKCPATIAHKRRCCCSYTLVLHDSNPVVNHRRDCCKARISQNILKKAMVDLAKEIHKPHLQVLLMLTLQMKWTKNKRTHKPKAKKQRELNVRSKLKKGKKKQHGSWNYIGWNLPLLNHVIDI